MATYRDGARAALPLVLPTLALGASFGVLARGLGWGVIAPVAMSVVVFSGSAQFAVASVLSGGGSMAAAVLVAVLVNARFLPMGIAVAPVLRGGRLRRAAEGQAVVDASWVLAAREGGFDRGLLLGATAPQFAGWVGGTVLGVTLGSLIGDPARFGLDALFPAFFLALLAEEIRDARRARVALAAAAIALALIAVVPPGLPILAACAAALAGARAR
jgi:4-azaleucine resistance transporter AzlC